MIVFNRFSKRNLYVHLIFSFGIEMFHGTVERFNHLSFIVYVLFCVLPMTQHFQTLTVMTYLVLAIDMFI